MEVQVGGQAEKQGRRLRALRECFHRVLKIAFSCPSWEVRPRLQGRLSWIRNDRLAMQEFRGNFPDLPETYVAALFDLFQQVCNTAFGLFITPVPSSGVNKHTPAHCRVAQVLHLTRANSEVMPSERVQLCTVQNAYQASFTVG